MALGIVFGYIFVWSGNLWIPIILHFFFNGITVVAFFLNNIGAININPDTLGRSNNFLVILFSLTISIIIMLYMYRKKDKNNFVGLLPKKKEETQN